MKRKKILILFALLPVLLLFMWLDWLANWERQADPLQVRVPAVKDEKRPDSKSEEILAQDDLAVWYEDRVRYHFPSVGNAERIDYLRHIWEAFSPHIPGEADSYIVPIPTPILFEEGMEADVRRYQDFIAALGEGMQKGAVIDLYETLEEHKDEYLYYNETPALANLGAYYAADGLLKAMGEDGLLPITDYEEELYYGLYESETELTYLYTLPGSKGYCEAFHVESDGTVTSNKRPVWRDDGAATGSAIGSGRILDWAVLEGDGDESAGTLLLIGDSSGKAMAPFLANHFHQVYFVSVDRDSNFGTEYHPYHEIVESYDIRKAAYVHWASEMGEPAYMAAFKALYREDGGKRFE